jgi:putative transposase
MRHINGVYTQRYNKAHGHDGQLFRGRFKAILVDGDSYLLQLVRYIHRNPVRAGIANRPELYRWSSHKGYLSSSSQWDWLYKEFFLSILSPRKSTQRAAYRQYMGEEDSEAIAQILNGKKWPPIIGDEASINRLKARFFEQKVNPQVPDSRSLAPDVPGIVQAVCSHYGINESELAKCRRGRFNEPRAVAVYLTRMIRKDSFADIGSAFGLKSYSAVGAVLESMRKRQAVDAELSQRCRRIQTTLTYGQTET